MSHQITLWNNSYLLSQLPDNEHPWRNERRGSKRLLKSDVPIYQIDLFAENGKGSINDNIDDSLRSAYTTVSVNACLQPTARTFLEEMKMQEPDYVGKLEFNISNQPVHDGQSKPRKTDIIKRIKNLLKK